MFNVKMQKQTMKIDKLLMKVSCDPMCGFSITSHDEKELIGFVRNHAKNAHNKKVTADEIKGMMEMA